MPYVVKMAVDIKVSKQESTLVGNYEFYYAAGRLAALLNTDELTDELPPHDLEKKVRELLPAWTPGNVEEKYLSYLLDRYEAEDDYNNEIKRMFRIGKGLEKA